MTAIEPKILLITADAASVSDGKINMLGGGWTQISSGPANFTLVARLTIPWTMTNSQLPWSLELIDEDGHLYRPEPGADPVQITAELNVERPDGIPEGSSLDVPLIFPFIGLPLRPGAYEWVFSLAGASAKYAFQVF